MVEMPSPDELDFLHTLSRENGFYQAHSIGGGRYAAIKPMAYTFDIVVGQIGNHSGTEDCWCYHSLFSAAAALKAWHVWDYRGEPKGWHRHPESGRRLAETNGCVDGSGMRVAIGTIYVRR